MSLPVFSNSDGRTVIGHANGVGSAILVIRKLITVPQGWKLAVWKRDWTMCDILDQPEGFVYCIYR